MAHSKWSSPRDLQNIQDDHNKRQLVITIDSSPINTLNLPFYPILSIINFIFIGSSQLEFSFLVGGEIKMGYEVFRICFFLFINIIKYGWKLLCKFDTQGFFLPEEDEGLHYISCFWGTTPPSIPVYRKPDRR